MEKIISSIPVYNLLTNLIPGTVLAALLKFCVEGCDIFSLTNNMDTCRYPLYSWYNKLSDKFFSF